MENGVYEQIEQHIDGARTCWHKAVKLMAEATELLGIDGMEAWAIDVNLDKMRQHANLAADELEHHNFTKNHRENEQD